MILNYNRSIIGILLFLWGQIIVQAVVATTDDQFYWACSTCDRKCPAAWEIQEQPPHGFDWNTLQVNVQKQRFDLKKKMMRGESLEIFGKSLWIRADQTVFDYHPHAMRWSLNGDVLAHIPGVYVQSESGIFDQTEESFQGTDIKFFLPRYWLYGSAKNCVIEQNKVTIRELETTQCEVSQPSWFFRIHELNYDVEKDYLRLIEPSLYLWGYEIFHSQEFSFQGLRSENQLESIPRIHIETQSGPAVIWPILWTNENENLSIIPQINFKQGIGLGANVVKDNIYAKTFMQFVPLGPDSRDSWMVSIASTHEDSDLSYGYQGSLVSDPEFCYRYPGAIYFWEKLYLVNQGWIQQDTPFGSVRLSTEKLYRSEEARQNDYEVIEYLGRADWTSHQKGHFLNMGADFIHRYGDATYSRMRAEIATMLSPESALRTRLSAYPNNDYFVGSFWVNTPVMTVNSAAGHFKMLATGALSGAPVNQNPLLLDIIAQPMSADFLTNPMWHTGLDWGSRGFWVTPVWSLALDREISAEVAVAYALALPTLPWNAPDQPYLTPFRENHRFSPMAVKVQGATWTLQTLYDWNYGEWIRSEMFQDIFFEKSHVRSGIFYHRYYPEDRLSQTVQAVAQYYFAYESEPEDPWKMKIEVTSDLIPIKIVQAKIKYGYEDCCWSWGVFAGVDQEYDPDTQLSDWHYTFGFSVDFQAVGMLKTKEEHWRGPLEGSVEPYQQLILKKYLANRAEE